MSCAAPSGWHCAPITPSSETSETFCSECQVHALASPSLNPHCRGDWDQKDDSSATSGVHAAGPPLDAWSTAIENAVIGAAAASQAAAAQPGSMQNGIPQPSQPGDAWSKAIRDALDSAGGEAGAEAAQEAAQAAAASGQQIQPSQQAQVDAWDAAIQDAVADADGGPTGAGASQAAMHPALHEDTQHRDDLQRASAAEQEASSDATSTWDAAVASAVADADTPGYHAPLQFGSVLNSLLLAHMAAPAPKWHPDQAQAGSAAEQLHQDGRSTSISAALAHSQQQQQQQPEAGSAVQLHAAAHQEVVQQSRRLQQPLEAVGTRSSDRHSAAADVGSSAVEMTPDATVSSPPDSLSEQPDGPEALTEAPQQSVNDASEAFAEGFPPEYQLPASPHATRTADASVHGHPEAAAAAATHRQEATQVEASSGQARQAAAPEAATEVAVASRPRPAKASNLDGDLEALELDEEAAKYAPALLRCPLTKVCTPYDTPI